MEILHLATPAQWASAQTSGWVTPPSLASEGFVHCSTPAQVEGTIARHFAELDELVLLRLHHDQLAADLRWEEGRGGETYPHVYRPIALSEVAEAIPWHRAAPAPPTPPS